MTAPPGLGEPAPWFHAQALDGNPRYAFDTAGGRWIVLLLMGSGGHAATQGALRLLEAHRDLFDDERAAFFGVTVDPADVDQGRIARQIPGIRWFLDYDRKVSASFGAISEGESASYAPFWLLLDPMLRIAARATLQEGPGFFAGLRSRVTQAADLATAPVLIIPDVLPRAMCRLLVETYEQHGGIESGFMREKDGVTVEARDHAHKRRADHALTDELLLKALKSRMSAVVRPMIQRAFQFNVNRIERFIVACYDGADLGGFRPHRDNTTKGTAHRKFACTINLNAEEYDGGDLCFPEFGKRTYRAPTGGAVVFSCSLLHEAKPVTRGKRYAFLPFLYDDDGARIREANLPFVGEGLQGYRSGLPSQPVPTS